MSEEPITRASILSEVLEISKIAPAQRDRKRALKLMRSLMGLKKATDEEVMARAEAAIFDPDFNAR